MLLLITYKFDGKPFCRALQTGDESCAGFARPCTLQFARKCTAGIVSRSLPYTYTFLTVQWSLGDSQHNKIRGSDYMYDFCFTAPYAVLPSPFLLSSPYAFVWPDGGPTTALAAATSACDVVVHVHRRR